MKVILNELLNKELSNKRLLEEKAKQESASKERLEEIVKSISKIEKWISKMSSKDYPDIIQYLFRDNNHEYPLRNSKKELRDLKFRSTPDGGFNASCQTEVQVYSAILLLDKGLKVKVDISKDMDE